MQVGRKKLTFLRILDPRMDVNKAHKFACLMTLKVGSTGSSKVVGFSRIDWPENEGE